MCPGYGYRGGGRKSADQSEGITNNNEGGLEPGTGETEAGDRSAGRTLTKCDPAGDNTAGWSIPLDDGLGLPDDMPANFRWFRCGHSGSPEAWKPFRDGDCAGRSGRDDGDDAAGCTVIPVKTGHGACCMELRNDKPSPRNAQGPGRATGEMRERVLPRGEKTMNREMDMAEVSDVPWPEIW